MAAIPRGRWIRSSIRIAGCSTRLSTKASTIGNTDLGCHITCGQHGQENQHGQEKKTTQKHRLDIRRCGQPVFIDRRNIGWHSGRGAVRCLFGLRAI